MSTAMRLLLLSGASSTHTIRWANAFVDRGIGTHLVTQHDPVDPPDPRVRVHRLPHLGGAGYAFNGPRLRALVQEYRIDVINAHYATGYGLLARWRGRVPCVLNVWGSDVYDFPEKSALHRAFLRTNLRAADRIISTSHAMAARTRAICPGLGSVTVVPFGVDTTCFAPASTGRSADAPRVVGTVKVLDEKYGIDTLIDAFARVVRHADRSVRLRIVGDGPQRPELERKVQAMGLAANVDFIGRVPHARVPDELRKMDVFVALSTLDSESFGVAVIEASACGLPVVVSDAGGLPEVVRDGVTGHVVKRRDPVAAGECIGALLRDPVGSERMGRAGREHVRQVYEWDRCVDAQITVIQECLAAGGSSTSHGS
ncbi:MAG TPA: glycosyltransferase [Flavobacteriales bacterium]|nr:glycosyltransferase [Flavobacteriales bacterium]